MCATSPGRFPYDLPLPLRRPSCRSFGPVPTRCPCSLADSPGRFPPRLFVWLGRVSSPSYSSASATSWFLWRFRHRRAAWAGVVVEELTLRPLAGAQVVVEGTGRGTLTDADGRFLLTGLIGSDVTLRVVMIGYRGVTRSVATGTTDLRIALAESAIELNEVVVTGTPGATRKRAIGNAVATVDAEQILAVAEPATVQQLLSSRVPGVNILKGAGEIGTGAATTIRGVGSLALSHEPLIYVDGMRIDNNANQVGDAFRAGSGASRINDIDPNDIASIEVIKGPAAATLYGTEASNGVIQIITKKGVAGTPKWTFEVKQGANFLQDPEEVFPTVWGRDESGLVSLNIIANDIEQGFGSPFSTGYVQQYLASVSGGSDDLRYYVSGGWGRDEGIVDYNWQNKLDLRSNLQYQLQDKLELGVNLGVIRQTTRAASTEQPITTHIVWGLPALRDTPRRGYLAVTPEAFEDVEGLEDVDRTTLSTQLQHRPFQWFTHRLTLGGDFGNVRSSGLWPRTAEQPGPHGADSRGLKQVTNTRSTYTTADYSATANFAVTDRLGSSTSAGVQFFRKGFEIDETEGQVFPVPGVETVSGAATRFADEDFLENRTLGVFFQEQISWNDPLLPDRRGTRRRQQRLRPELRLRGLSEVQRELGDQRGAVFRARAGTSQYAEAPRRVGPSGPAAGRLRGHPPL